MKCGHKIKFWRQITYLLIVCCAILMGASLYGQSDIQCILYMAVLLVSEAIIVLDAIASHGIQLEHLRKWAVYVIIIMMVYLVSGFATSHFGSNGLKAFLVVLSISPLFFSAVASAEELNEFARIAVTAVAVLAASSLILWIAGPITQLISFNCQIENRWNPEGELSGFYQGYFGLLYQTQWQQIGSLAIVRNTGIYAEGPMYVYVLVIALAIKVFYLPKKGKITSLLLALTILSTLSVTGVAATVLIYGLKILTSKSSRISKKQKITLLVTVALLALFGLSNLILAKLRTPSGNIHFDDYRACFLAWINNPIFGIGFSNDSDLISYMSTFRMDNTGYSNTLPYVMATGGLLYLTVWAGALSAYILIRDSHHVCFGIVAAFLLFTTAAATLFTTALILSFGAYLLISNRVCVGTQRNS